MDQNLLQKVKVMLQQQAEEMGIELISCRFYSHPENGPTLEVLIDKDYAIDMDTIQAYTDRINPLLDELDDSPEGYMLDVSSGGSEREIPFFDLPKLVSHYLDIKLAKSGETITARLLKAEPESMDVVYFIKGRKKQLTLTKDDVDSIHMGYKA